MNIDYLSMSGKTFEERFGFPPLPRTPMPPRAVAGTITPMPDKLVQRAAAKLISTYDRNRVVALRQRLVALGYRFVPVVRDDKKCTMQEWSKRLFSPDDYNPRYASTGILLDGKLVVIDIDTGYLPHVEILLEIVSRIAPGAVIRRRGNSARVALIFRIADGETISKVSDLLVKMEDEFDEWGHSKEPKFEILTGGFLHIDGERAGHPLELIQSDGTPDMPAANDLTPLTQAQLDQIRAEIAALGLLKTAAPAAQASALTTGSLKVSQTVAAPSVSTGFNMALFKSGLIALFTAKANIGDAGFQAVIAGTINEVRLTAPHMEPNVVAMLKAALQLLPGWNAAKDNARIASYASPNLMKSKPKRFGSFISEVDRHVPGWRNGGTQRHSATHLPGTAATQPAVEDLAWTPASPTDWQAAKRGAAAPPLIAGGVAIKGAVTVVASPGGRGKSAFAVAFMAHLASGTDVLGFGTCTPLRVAAIFLEEPASTIGARVEALETLHPGLSINPGMTLFCGMECGGDLLLWTSDARGNSVKVESGFAGIADLMAAFDVVILDSLGMVLENSSGANDQTVAGKTMRHLQKIADENGSALIVVMHERKPKPGDSGGSASSVTGSTKWVDHARGAFTLVEPAGKEAAALGILPGEEGRYIALRAAKANYTAKGQDRYFEKVGVPLASGGTAVAIRPWKPNSGVAASLLVVNRQAVIDVIAKAEAAGAPLSRIDATRAQKKGETCAEIEAAKELLARNPSWHPARADVTAKQIIADLFKGGTLVHDKAPGTRREIWRVAP